MRWSMKSHNVRTRGPYVLHLGVDVTEGMLGQTHWLREWGYPVSAKSTSGLMKKQFKTMWETTESERGILQDAMKKKLAEIIAKSKK